MRLARVFSGQQSSHMPSVIGSSIAEPRAQHRASAGAVVSPSTVLDDGRPQPGSGRSRARSARPRGRFRLSWLQPVTTRSPMPARPDERLEACAGGVQPRHPARPRVSIAAFRVVPELEPVDHARGERHHVLCRAAELHAEHVGVQVDAERPRRSARAGATSPSSRRWLAITDCERLAGDDLGGEVRAPTATRDLAASRRGPTAAGRSPGRAPCLRLSTGAVPPSKRDHVPNHAARDRDRRRASASDRRISRSTSRGETILGRCPGSSAGCAPSHVMGPDDLGVARGRA